MPMKSDMYADVYLVNYHIIYLLRTGFQSTISANTQRLLVGYKITICAILSCITQNTRHLNLLAIKNNSLVTSNKFRPVSSYQLNCVQTKSIEKKIITKIPNSKIATFRCPPNSYSLSLFVRSIKCVFSLVVSVNFLLSELLTLI